MSSSVPPRSFTIVSMFRTVCRTWSPIAGPAYSPGPPPGLSGVWPEMNTNPFATTAWEYGPRGFTKSLIAGTCFIGSAARTPRALLRRRRAAIGIRLSVVQFVLRHASARVYASGDEHRFGRRMDPFTIAFLAFMGSLLAFAAWAFRQNLGRGRPEAVWDCLVCRITNEGTLEVCWNCGRPAGEIRPTASHVPLDSRWHCDSCGLWNGVAREACWNCRRGRSKDGHEAG